MWSNNYIGIPFKYKGRTKEDGLDCWGLARLIYKNEYNISLPSFSADYEDSDYERIEDLIAQYKEGWEAVSEPEEGNIVVLRIMGAESHIGVAVSKTHFIHAREGSESAIEAFDSPSWKKRIVGYFKYSTKGSAVLNAVPHPLRTERYTVPIPTGTKLDVLAAWILKEYNVAEEIKSKVNILVNGKLIPKEKWSLVTLKDSDTIEYRAVANGGNSTRLLLTAALIIFAPEIAASAEFAAMPYVGSTFASAAVYATAYAATIVVGSMLIDAIAPIRLPPDPRDAGASERQLMATGGQNRANPYGAIPVVLGKVRYTPPLGAVNYLTYESERSSYLTMLLTWGYGPLTIDQNSFRIGEQPISNYTDYTLVTLDRKTEPTAEEDSKFKAIYGNDITQVNSNLTLTCDGNPEVEVAAGPWAEAISTEAVDSVTIALHFPQGLRKISISGGTSGTNYAAPTKFEVEYFYNSTWTSFSQLEIGADAPKKDAFTFTKTYSTYSNDIPINTGLSVRIRRITGDNTEDNPSVRYSHTSVLQNVTFTRNAKPLNDPVNCKIAKSAFKVKATDQLNGNIEGINAIVQTYCKAWNGSAWVDSSTSNPAALFRYVLENPANAQRITNDAKFDLNQLQYWSTYCDAKGFEYNSVLAAQRSILEVLRDICAAGRASPALVDGKWTVVIDEPKPNIIQHFTPHNSWGFESSKNLTKLPDGLKVTFYDETQNYQEVEIIVYNAGKGENNAELFESISLPGVTKASSVIDHARWHFAQAKLRPEVYTINADIEYLVCNRGDRVKVMHDTPMWGLASGRIKNRVSSTVFELDEAIPMGISKAYTIRVRSADGSSIVRNIEPVTADGYYSTITLTESATESEINFSDLFMVGDINSEAVDLLILSIEPTTNKSARITLVDYGVTDEYNIYNDYLTLSENVVFQSKITLAPELLIETFGTKIPTITNLLSDETVMEKVADGVFRYNLAVAYVNANSLPKNTASVEAQYDYAAATDNLNQRSVFISYDNGGINIPDVKEGDQYKVRLRYVSTDGRIGKWTEWVNHTISGKTTKPSNVTGFIATAEFNTGRLRLSWNINTEVDIKGYEVRTEDAEWGTEANRIFYGSTNNCSTLSEDAQHTTIYYIKAIDYGDNYSATSTSVVYSAPVPNKPTSLSYTYGTSSNTHSTVTFSWQAPTSAYFAIKEYELVISKPDHADEIVYTTSTKYISNADWLGNATIYIKSIDTGGSSSSAAILTVPKYAPNPLVSFNADVVDNNVLLRWTLPDKTSLPISHILIKRGISWELADKIIGEKSGTFTSIFELAGGNYTYWLAVVDTDGRESIPTPISLSVSQPPDFVFNAEYISTLQGTMSNVGHITNSTSLLMLINNSETWAQHFSSHSWNSPLDQINASYPVYAQPNTTPAYYQESFNYGQILTSSSITTALTGSIVSGNPTVYTEIETSVDGSTWTTPQRLEAVFATNFQYIRVTIRAVANSAIDLYRIDKLVVRLDNKQISDSGTADCSSSDSLGTIVNFNKEFIDIQSITLTPSGTTPLTSVYDFKDALISGTYSITSNVCTVNATAHGLISGQNVRLAFTSGTAISDTYTITKINDNQYTVSVTGQPNTSGNVVTYSQSMRIYVFTSTSGVRQNAKVGWSIKGY